MDPDDPISFAGQGFPSGTLKVDGRIKAFLNKPSGNLALSDGHVSMSIQRKMDGAVTGIISAIEGGFMLQTGASKLSWYLMLHDLNFTSDSAGHSFSAHGRLTGKLLSGNELLLAVPGNFNIPGHGDAAQYPLNFGVRWVEDTQIPDTPVDFGGRFPMNDDATLSVKTRFRLDIPPGQGEHESHKDAGSADGTHGPDDDQHRQEAFQDSGPACTVHLYLVSAL